MSVMPPVPYPGEEGWTQGSFGWYDAQLGAQNDCGIFVTATPSDAVRRALIDSQPWHGKIVTTCEELLPTTTHIHYIAFCMATADHLYISKYAGGCIFELLYKPDQYFEGFSYVFSRKDFCGMPWNLEWNDRPPPQFPLFDPDYNTVAQECRDEMKLFFLPDLYISSFPSTYQGSRILFNGALYDDEQDVRDNAPLGKDWYGFSVFWQLQKVLLTKTFVPVFGGSPLPIMPPLFPFPPLGIGGMPFGVLMGGEPGGNIFGGRGGGGKPDGR